MMKYRPYENPSTSKQASVIPWITGASIAFLALINLAMFFWSGQASFALLAFLCAVYLPTPLTNSRMDGVGAWSYFTSVAAALAYGAICAVQCWWITLLALVTTISATWLLYRQHRKQSFHLPRRPGMTFQCPSDQVWIPLYHFAMLLVFAILSMRSFPISISLFLVLLSLLAAAFGLRNWAWGIALEPDGPHSLQPPAFQFLFLDGYGYPALWRKPLVPVRPAEPVHLHRPGLGSRNQRPASEAGRNPIATTSPNILKLQAIRLIFYGLV
ncbi:MAG: hypothetical protein ACLU9S_12305 [Oscillospiraceae bacterium]